MSDAAGSRMVDLNIGRGEYAKAPSAAKLARRGAR